MFWNGSDEIKFLCDPRCKDVIPEPYPAKRLIPDWFKRLDPTFQEEGKITPASTIKRCPPFLDAMSVGWIIPLAADIHFLVSNNGERVCWESDFVMNMCESHNLKQIAGHPKVPSVPLKFLNHWLIQTPPGWSTIFTMPFNRPDGKLDLMTGIVETDKYFEFVNFPGFLKVTDGPMKLERGYPLMQAIPFKRDYKKAPLIDSLTGKDLQKLNKTRDRRSSERSYYRDNLWEKKV